MKSDLLVRDKKKPIQGSRFMYTAQIVYVVWPKILISGTGQ